MKNHPDFHEILYTAADFKLDERHVIKNKKVALDRLRIRQNVFLVMTKVTMLLYWAVAISIRVLCRPSVIVRLRMLLPTERRGKENPNSTDELASSE